MTASTTMKSILLIVDHSERHTAAFYRAIALAKASGAHLHLALFDHDPLIEAAGTLVSFEVRDLAKKQFLSNKTQRLGMLASTAKIKGIAASYEAIWAPSLDEAVLDHVLHTRPDMVVKDAQQDSSLLHILHTSDDQRLLRCCPAPLMLVQPTAQPAPLRIAAAMDVVGAYGAGHPMNTMVIGAARNLVAQFSAELHLVHVQTPFVALSPESAAFYEVYANMMQENRLAFVDYCGRQRIPDNCRHVLLGNTASELVGFCDEQKIDLLVVGSLYRDRIDRFVIGSTAESVAKHIKRDLLLVKPEGFEAELAKHLDLRAVHHRQIQAAA